ncbi:MAG: hypothetical protein J6L24_03880 [Oscillospiraceae bacterium]|nr:hypothetical protein [Oscillospiraceae bacterium]
MGLPAVLAGLFGKAPGPVRHELSETKGISISCCHMDRSFGYSFWIRREGDAWLFDAECFTHDHEVETVFENREVADGDRKALFAILERCGSISYAEHDRKPKKSPFQILDETTYCFCLTFSDGSRYVTRDRQKELEAFFYRLAEQTGDAGNRL